MGQRPWTADQTVLNGWRLPACLPSHRLSSPYNDAARPKCPGASASNLRQARYRHVYLYGGPLSCSASQHHQENQHIM